MSERYILRIINSAEEAPNKQDIRLLGTQSVDKSLCGSWTQRTKIDPLDYFVLCHSPTHIPADDPRSKQTHSTAMHSSNVMTLLNTSRSLGALDTLGHTLFPSV